MKKFARLSVNTMIFSFIILPISIGAQERLAPPSSSELQPILSDVQELFRAKYSAAKTKGGNASLARELQKQAMLENENKTLRYVLLTEAAKWAIDSDQPELGLRAIDSLALTHAIPIGKMKLELFQANANTLFLKKPTEQVAFTLIRSIDDAALNDEFDACRGLVEQATQILKSSSLTGFLPAIEVRLKALETAETFNATGLNSLQQVRSGTGSPDHNLAAGRYLCFRRGQWRRGLEYLSKGSNSALQELAVSTLTALESLEAGQTVETLERVRLGNEWWKQIEKEDPFSRRQLKTYAVSWYLPVVALLDGATHRLVEERCDEVNATLIFDGTGYIETQLVETFPIMLEAWVQPGVQPQKRWVGNKMTSMAQIMGSDIGGKYGYGFGVLKGKIHIEFITGFHETKARIPSNRMSHIRILFRPEKTYVFLDGRNVAEYPPSKSRSEGRFVIGTFGVKNTGHLFVGQIRQVRISRAENIGFRDFRPQKYMPVTKHTLLLYDALGVEGTQIIDRTPNGKDGQLKGVYSQTSIIR